MVAALTVSPAPPPACCWTVRPKPARATIWRISCWACPPPVPSATATPTSISADPFSDGFVNDDWRIAPRFSLVFGLRYEYATPMTELYNRLVNLAVAPGYSAVTAVLAGQSTLPAGMIRPDRNNFSPRVGFAWRPWTRGTLVVRGGYGVYYNTSVYNQIAANMAQQPPFAEFSCSASPPRAADPLTPAALDFWRVRSASNTSTFAVDPNYRIGYAQTWNLSVQHDLPLSMFATVGYLGTKGTRLDQQFIPNSVAPGAAVSPYPNNFTYETSNGDSIYHALQLQLNRRFHSGFMWHGVLPILEVDRQCRHRRPRPGHYAGGAKLARPGRRARPFQLRRAPQSQLSTAIQHRNGYHQRNPAERLEGLPCSRIGPSPAPSTCTPAIRLQRPSAAATRRSAGPPSPIRCGPKPLDSPWSPTGLALLTPPPSSRRPPESGATPAATPFRGRRSSRSTARWGASSAWASGAASICNCSRKTCSTTSLSQAGARCSAPIPTAWPPMLRPMRKVTVSLRFRF